MMPNKFCFQLHIRFEIKVSLKSPLIWYLVFGIWYGGSIYLDKCRFEIGMFVHNCVGGHMTSGCC